MIVYSIVPASRRPSDKDDRWDADAVSYLLRAGARDLDWSYGILLGCLREQPAMLRRVPHGIEIATNAASRFGVEKRREPAGRGSVVHLYRTDELAPTYPVSTYERRVLQRVVRTPGEERRVCAVCGHLGVPIVWGMVTGADREGGPPVVFGGCCVEPFDTQCLGCGWRWDSERADHTLAVEDPRIALIEGR